MTDSGTPELDKQSVIIATGAPQAVGEFLEWLSSQGLRLCAWREDLTEAFPCPDALDAGKHASRQGCIGGQKARWGHTADPDGEPYGACPRCAGNGHIEREVHARFVEDPRTPEQLLADHFGIDRDKIEAERRALLASLRAGC